MPCADDCLVSDWSAWTSCDHGLTNRKRDIVRPGKYCPDLTKTVRCASSVFEWRNSDWSSCFMEQGMPETVSRYLVDPASSHMLVTKTKPCRFH